MSFDYQNIASDEPDQYEVSCDSSEKWNVTCEWREKLMGQDFFWNFIGGTYG